MQRFIGLCRSFHRHHLKLQNTCTASEKCSPCLATHVFEVQLSNSCSWAMLHYCDLKCWWLILVISLTIVNAKVLKELSACGRHNVWRLEPWLANCARLRFETNAPFESRCWNKISLTCVFYNAWWVANSCTFTSGYLLAQALHMTISHSCPFFDLGPFNALAQTQLST